MATTKYFSGDTEFNYAYYMKNAEFAERFPGVRGIRLDSFEKLVGKTPAGDWMPITRRIFFKANPSLHKCDARCTNAKGHNCECSCGGKNHGRNG